MNLRTLWRSLLAALVLAAGARGYDKVFIDASVNDSTRVVTGTITVAFDSLAPSFPDIRFRLYANALCERKGAAVSATGDACGTIIDSVFVDGADMTKQTSVDKTILIVPRPADRARTRIAVEVRFHTFVPVEMRERLSLFQGKYFLDGWYPIPWPRRNGQWQVVSYGPQVELVDDFWNFDLRFRHPKDWQLVGAGIVKSYTSGGSVTDSISLPRVFDVSLVLAKNLRERDYMAGGTTLKFWYEPSSEFYVDSLAASARFTYRYLSDRVEPYPFDEMVILVATIPEGGGVESPRFVIVAPPIYPSATRLDRFVTIHEVTHEWFYYLLASNQAEDPWLDEGVTEYFSTVIDRAEAGPDTKSFDYLGFTMSMEGTHRLQTYSFLDKLPITQAAISYSLPAYGGVVYGKGALVLEMFGKLLGPRETEFWKEYYRRFAFGHPNDSDFFALANTFPPFDRKQNAAKVLTTAEPVDYRVMDVKAERVEPTNAGTAAKSDTADMAGKRDKAEVAYRSTVSYAMYHPFDFPVGLRLRYADGTTWDTTLTPSPGDGELTVTRRSPAESATIDPERVFAVDMNLLNNSYTTTGAGEALRLVSGITFLIESLYSLLWGM